MLRNEDGFTVIEILIGIALFGIVMPSVIIAVVQVARLNDRAADLTRANVIAEHKIESLRSARYNSLDVGSVDFTNELDSSFSSPKSATYVVTMPETGLKKVDITISYLDNGATRSLTFSSFISELGVTQ